MRQLWKLDVGRHGRRQEGWILVYVQGVLRGAGIGERSARTKADGGRLERDGCRTTIGRYMIRTREQIGDDRSEQG